MKIPTLLVAVFSFAFLTAQNLKTKKEYHKYFKEIYSIDKKTKLKEGLYVQLDLSTGDTLTKGFFNADKRSGQWEFYRRGEGLVYTYDYGTNTVQFYDPERSDSIVIPVLRSGNFLMEQVDHEPVYLGYTEEFKDRILSKIDIGKLIERAKKNEGITILSMVVDARGQPRALRVEETHDLEVAKMFMRAVEEIEGHWLPAIKDGSPINTKIYILNDLRSRMSTEPAGKTYNFEDKPGVYIINTHFIGVRKVTTQIR